MLNTSEKDLDSSLRHSGIDPQIVDFLVRENAVQNGNVQEFLHFGSGLKIDLKV
jgi:hypothetical protein